MSKLTWQLVDSDNPERVLWEEDGAERIQRARTPLDYTCYVDGLKMAVRDALRELAAEAEDEQGE